MKKQLMITTALVAAGMLAVSGAALAQKKAGKPVLKVGGYFGFDVGAVDQDDTSPARVAFDVIQDSEIHFKGSVTLDNGIKIRTRVELEGQSGKGSSGTPNNSNDIIDEAYMAISGDFGSLRLGSEDSAPHLMVTPYSGHWAANVGSNTAFDTADWIDNPDGHSLSTVNRLDIGDADADKVTYFTPRIEGLQVGVTYMPGLGANHEGQNGAVETRTDSFEGFAIGANYNQKFGGGSVGLAAGYITANKQGQESDPEGVAAGIRLKFGGATVSFGYHREWNMSADTSANKVGTTDYMFGASYQAGKNGFSIGYSHVEGEGTRANTSEDEIDHFKVSYEYTLGPSVEYRLNFFYADWQGEDTGTLDDNEGIAVSTGIRVSF